jgi:glycosyltransferase involved in cell wall biosynthesis
METIRLSICILSYNQVSEIEQLLGSLRRQITPEVEVVIRDDSTNDETERLVERFQKEFPIRYIHGEKGGIDRTVIFLTEEARGEFVWWLGDETVEPDGVRQVLSVIKSHQDVSFIWANYHVVGTTTAGINLPADRFFVDRSEVLKEARGGLGFISSTIFRKQTALSGIESSKRYIGSEFSNLFIIMHVLSQPGRAYYLCGPIIINHPATSEEVKVVVVRNGENRAFDVFGVAFTAILSEFRDFFAPAVVDKVLRRNFSSVWKGIFVGWVGGWDTPKGKRMRMLRLFGQYPEAWVAVVLFSLPKIINIFIYRIFRLCFRRKRSSATK